MRISYNKLWKLLIDMGMNKQDLKNASGISAASIAKLGKGENITTDVLLKICDTLHCRLEDILKTVDTEGKSGCSNLRTITYLPHENPIFRTITYLAHDY